MNDIERFLEENTIRCIPLHARISRAQCGVNIRSGDFGYCATCPERHLAVFEEKSPVTGQRRNALAYPRKPTKQKDVEEPTMTPDTEKKTWTTSELAVLCGVKTKDVRNARGYSGGVIPGSVRHGVLEKMRELGITWDDVTFSPRGRSKKRPCSTPEAETRQDVPAVEMREDVFAEAPTDALPQAESAIIPDTETIPVNNPDADADPVNASVAGTPPAALPGPMTLEHVLAELKRLLPGASITISL